MMEIISRGSEETHTTCAETASMQWYMARCFTLFLLILKNL